MKLIVIDNLEPPSSNVYAVGGKILIDSGCDEGIVKKLNEKGISNESVKLIVNTHSHFDHVSCNHLFPKAKVCMHSIEADSVMRLGSKVTLSDVELKVDRRLEDGDEIGSLKAIHTPGHTAGSICLLFGDILFSGDTVFLGAVGRTDLPTGDPAELEKSIRKLALLPFKFVYAGHGPIAKREAVFER